MGRKKPVRSRPQRHPRAPRRRRAAPDGRLVVMIEDLLLRPAPLFADRHEAGVALAAELRARRAPEPSSSGSREEASRSRREVARILEAPLDVVAVRKVGHPWQPEYGLGAVTPGDGVYLRGSDGLTDEELAAAVEAARAKAALLDERLHAEHGPLELTGKTALVVDDGLATGGTMIAALRWAKAAGAARVVAAVPVAAEDSLEARSRRGRRGRLPLPARAVRRRRGLLPLVPAGRRRRGRPTSRREPRHPARPVNPRRGRRERADRRASARLPRRPR